MSVIFYTKPGCVLCDEAEIFITTHNIRAEKVYVKSLSEVMAIHREDVTIEDTNVSSFPMFFDPGTKTLLTHDEFVKTFGETILLPNPNRHVLFPIEHPSMWTMYEKAVASFWTVNEIDFSRDEHDYDKVLTPDERFFINHILAFFAASDGIVNENLARNFSDEVQVSEARAFYSYQQFNETVHSHNYSLMIDRYVKDRSERMKLFDGIHTVPAITKKADWASRWISKENCPCFAKRLIGFACVEGIMFSGSFCAIFWLKKRGLMPGLSFRNAPRFCRLALQNAAIPTRAAGGGVDHSRGGGSRARIYQGCHSVSLGGDERRADVAIHRVRGGSLVVATWIQSGVRVDKPVRFHGNHQLDWKDQLFRTSCRRVRQIGDIGRRSKTVLRYR